MLALASFILVVVAGLLAAAMVERVRSAAGWVAHSLEVQGAATQLLGTVQALELAERGYLLTRSDTFLAPINEPERRPRKRCRGSGLLSPTIATRSRGSTGWAPTSTYC